MQGNVLTIVQDELATAGMTGDDVHEHLSVCYLTRVDLVPILKKKNTREEASEHLCVWCTHVYNILHERKCEGT